MYPWKTLKVFTSSTFKDLELERDQLAKIFQKIREEIFSRRLQLISYDLRWQEREQDSLVKWCLQKVAECNYFIGILGYRYGYRPELTMEGTNNAQHVSITEMEINHALRTIPKNKRFFCFGDLEQYGDLLNTEKKEDIDSITRLKERLVQDGETIFTYQNAEQIIDIIYKQLLQIIDADYPKGTKAELTSFNRKDALKEIIEEKKLGFIGRTHYLQAIKDFCGHEGEKNYLAVHALAGTGKSALLAQFISNWQSESSIPIVAHYMSMAGNSRSATGILQSIGEQLVALKIIASLEEDIVYQVKSKLSTTEEKLIIAIDGLDELDEDAQDLNWLPSLPNNIKLIITTRPVGPWEKLQTYTQLTKLELPLLNDSEIQTIISNYQQQKKLDLSLDEQKILAKRAMGNPLFLKVALDEMSEGGIAVGQIAETVDGLFHQILKRLQDDYGQKAIEDYLGLIAAGRGGIAESELEQIMREEHPDHALQDFMLRIHKAFANFIVRRENLLNFFHPEFERSVKMFLGKYGMRLAHNKLAEYFLPKKYSYERSLSELPYQLQWSEKYQELLCLLSDLDFLEAKCTSGMFNSLLEDFERALYNDTVSLKAEEHVIHPCGSKVNKETLRLITRAMELDVQFIRRHPDLLFQCLWNRCYWHDNHLTTYYYTKEIMKMDTPWKKNEDELIYKIAEYWAKQKKGRHTWIKSKKPLFPGLDSPLLRSFHGHDGKVNKASFSPQGTEILSCGDDKSIKMWSVNTGENIFVSNRHTNKTNAVAFNNTGDIFASAGNDNIICLWSVSRKTLLKECSKHSLSITSLAFHPTNQKFLSGSYDGSICLWDTKGNCEHTFACGGDYVLDIAWSPQGDFFASAHHSGDIRIWDTTSKTETQVLKGHKGSVCSIIFTNNGKNIISAGDDKIIRIWSLATGKPLRMLKGHTQLISGLAIHPDGESLYSVSWDKTMRTWKLPEGNCVFETQIHDTEVRSIDISRDGRKLVTTGAEGSIRLWNSQGGSIYPFKGHESYIFNLDFTPAGDEIATGEGERVCVWSAKDGRCIKIVGGRYRTIHKPVENDSLLAEVERQETIVLPKRGRKKPMAYFPAVMRKVEFGPGTSKTFAGYFGSYVYILELVVN